MGILDKIMFWKKDDFSSLGLGDDDDFSMGSAPETTPNFSQEPKKPLPGEMTGTSEMPPGMGSEEPKGYGMPKYEELQQQQQPQRRDMPNMYPQSNKDMEIISAKLDSIRASLESMNTRLANLERIARGEYEKRW